jgi:diaminohydroxyphosphoribosylaminopyrimidine deaminase/5-amino-6-(5-phosphoribosylamino)uracil reductase
VLSGRALGRTSPNPPVGAVVLDVAGAVVGEGWTSPPGGPHAEVVALRQAGAAARGGTAVVTLEPCRHTGRTGPCTAALLEAGVARVVVACADPTELAGGGAELLRAAGIDVETGVLADEVARGPLEAWLTSRRTGRPFVTWKVAATLDGRSAAADGTSRWITGEPARRDVHRLRGEVDAVLAGSGTVLADDPQLDVRPDLRGPAERQPLRVVVDTRGRTPVGARVLAVTGRPWSCTGRCRPAPTHRSKEGDRGGVEGKGIGGGEGLRKGGGGGGRMVMMREGGVGKGEVGGGIRGKERRGKEGRE